MATKPTTYLNWTDGNALKQSQPPAGQLLSGWTAGQAPPYQWANWQIWLIDTWIQWLDQSANLTNPNIGVLEDARLINGGTWSFTASSGLLTWSAAFNIAIPSLPDAANQVAAGSATLADGQVMYVVANVPFSTTASISNGSTQMTGLAYQTGVVAGQTVSGTGIPAGTTVISISGTTVTLSQAATATVSGGVFTFSGIGALTAQVATNSSLVPASNTIVLARRVGQQLVLGMNAGEELFRDGEQKALRATGYDVIISAVAGVALTAGQPVYISPGASDGSRTQGAAYLTDTSSTNGSVRGNCAGFVMTAVASGATVQIITSGVITSLTGLTTGSTYYADPANIGGITATKPVSAGVFVMPVGIALSATQLVTNCAGQTPNTVVTGAGQGQYGISTEAQLTTALAACVTAGGGVIIVQGSFSMASAHTIPAGTVLLGGGGATIVTFTGSGTAFTLATGAKIRDLTLATTVSSGAILVLMSGNRAMLRDVVFQPPVSGTDICAQLTGSQNRLYNCVFTNCAGSSNTGIKYLSGTDNLDDSSVFL